jgi:hypothetical protein
MDGVTGRTDAKTGAAGVGSVGAGITGRALGSGVLRVTGSSGGAGRSGTGLSAFNFATNAGGIAGNTAGNTGGNTWCRTGAGLTFRAATGTDSTAGVYSVVAV